MGTQPYGCFLDLAEAVKQVVDVPVTAVGRILTPELAEQVLTSGQADLVGIGRGLIAEPDWPRKVQQGQREDLRFCIMCNHCASSLMTNKPLQCAVNAEIGEPVQATVQPAAPAKRVLVAGGGPAGMEAARVAAVRGHQVTLLEREDELGGQLALCAAPSFKEEINRLTEYLTGALRRLAVEVRTSTPLTAEALDELRPDVVIVATGARPAPLPVPADAHENVTTAWAALAGEVRLGRKVVLVGGGAVGVETALYLAAPEREVTIVEMLDRIGGQESPTMLPFLERWMQEAEIRILTGHKLVEVREDAVVLEAEGEPPVVVACDTLVNAVGTTRNAVLVDELSQRQLECHLVGDCSPTSAGTIADAIHEGHRAGAQV
jgi:NADPH-dependent 2,4-dienoyl-CoA reductase/sulfur reductase-like enzyme